MKFELSKYLKETEKLSRLEKLKYLWKTELTMIYLSLTLPLWILSIIVYWTQKPLTALLALLTWSALTPIILLWMMLQRAYSQENISTQTLSNETGDSETNTSDKSKNRAENVKVNDRNKVIVREIKDNTPNRKDMGYRPYTPRGGRMPVNSNRSTIKDVVANPYVNELKEGNNV